MAVDGYLNFDTKLDTSGFNGGLAQVNTTVTKSIEKVKNQLKTFAKIAAVAFSTYAITNFGKECIELGSDLAEVQNVVDVTFPAMTKQVDKWAKSAANSFGLSETMAKRYVGTFGSMAEAFGFTEKEAYDMSTTLTGLAGDVASFYNIRQDEAYTKLKSVFSGETETLKDLGIVMTQTALDSYALANGYGKTTAKMTEAEKVTLRYKFVQDQLANATGDFVRTQDSWANQTRILQLRLDSLKATLGQGLINVFSPLLKNLNSFIEKLDVATEKFKSFTEQVFGYSSATDNSANSASSEMTDLADETKSANSALATTSKKTKEIKDNLQGFDRLNVMSLDNSSSDDSTAVNSPTKKSSKAAVNALDTAATAIEKRTNKVFDSIKRALNNLKNVFVSIGESWKRVWKNGTGEKIIGNIKQLLKNVFDIIGDISGAFTKAWNKAGLGDAVVQSITDKWNSLLELVNTIAEDFRKVWNNGTGERIWTNILNIIKNCNNYTKTLRTKIKQAWDKNESGKKIWEAILGIVEDITSFLSDMSEIRLEWLESLDLSPLVSAVADLGQAFRDLLKACGDKLKQAYKNILLPFTKWTIEEAVPKLVEALAGALKFLGGVIRKIPISAMAGVAGAIAAIITALKGFEIYKKIKSAVENIKKNFDKLYDIVLAHPYAAAFMAIATAITAIVSAIKAYNQEKWNDSSLKKQLDKTQKLADEWQNLSDEMSNKIDEINDTELDLKVDFGNVDKLKKRLHEIIEDGTIDENEKGEYQTIVDLMSEKVDGFDEQWNNLTLEEIDGKIVIKNNIEEVSKSLDDLVNKWEIAQAKMTLSSVYSDLSTEKAKGEIQVETGQKQYKPEELKKDLADYIYQNSILSKKEAKIYTDELLKQKGDFIKTRKKLLKKFEDGLLDKNEYRNLFYSDNGQINMLHGGDDVKKHIQESVDGYWNASDALQNLRDNVDAYDKKLDETYSSLKTINGSTKDYTAYIKLASDGILSQDAVLSLLKDDGITTWEQLEKAASASMTSTSQKSKMKSGSIAKDNEDVQKSLAKSKGSFSELGDTVETSSDSSATGFSKNTKRIPTALEIMKNSIKRLLEQVKVLFPNAFESITKNVKKPMNGFLGVVQNFLNNFIDPFNSLGSAISGGMSAAAKIAYEALGSVKGIVGLPNITVPRLATGTVVPANYGEFLAVLGDNKREAEVVSPISTIKQALIEAMAEIGSTGDSGDINLTVNLDGEVIFNNIVKRNNAVKKRHGVGALG